MSKSDNQQKSASDVKQARLEEALRANLRRRKAQSRGRKAEARATTMDSMPKSQDSEDSQAK